TMVDHYEALCDRAAAQEPKPDLLVWPETSHPSGWGDVGPDYPPEHVRHDWLPPDGSDWRPNVRRKLNPDLFADVARWQTNVLCGVNTEVVATPDRIGRFNSAVLVRPDGWASDRYDKMHRVPFGEYVPLRDWLPWMNAFAPYDFDYSIRSGERFTRFP